MQYEIHSTGPMSSRHYRFFCTETKKYKSPVLNQKQVLPYYQYLQTRDFLVGLQKETIPIFFEEQLDNAEIVLDWFTETSVDEIPPEKEQMLAEQFIGDTEAYSYFLQKIGRLFPEFAKGDNLPTCLQMTGEPTP